jgi:hypothetical protein
MPVPTEEEIRQVQRQITDYFHHWRLGLGNRYDRRARKDAIANPIPHQGPLARL